MPKGPQELRLDTYVAGGSVASIRHSAHVWRQGQRVLERLAAALETVKPELNEKFGPKTGPAASAAFEKVARNVRDQAAEMERASSALTTAADALHDAQATHHRLGNAPAAPPPDATQKSGESAEAYHLRQRDVTASQTHYAAESAQRERDSRAAIHTVDTKYDHAIQVMESIHGQPARPHQGSGGAGGDGVPQGSVPGPSSTTGGPTGSTWQATTGGHDTPGGTHDPGGHETTDPGRTPGDPPTYDDPGVPQGPGWTDPSAPPATTSGGVPFGPAGGPHLSPAATSPALGTMLSGGIVGGTTAVTNGLTSGLSNAMRSTSMATLTAEEQAALSTSRTGTTAGVGGRGGAVGTTGTSRGTSRGGARGAAAGGRGDRGGKKKRRSGTDFFEDADEWLDDDEVSPGVLD